MAGEVKWLKNEKAIRVGQPSEMIRFQYSSSLKKKSSLVG